MPSSPWKKITPQGLVCIFWAESLSEYQLCIPVKVRQTPAVKDWSLLLFPWQALPCKNQLFSLPFLSLIRLRSRDFRFRQLLTSTNTNSLLAKVLTIASSFFVPFVAVSQGFTEISAVNRESLNWTSGSVFWIKNRVSLCFYRTQVLTIEKFIKR